MIQLIKKIFAFNSEVNNSIIDEANSVKNPKPTIYLFIFTTWILTLIWFHPRMIKLMSIATTTFEWIVLAFFVFFVELAWLYGIYNLGIVLFSVYYRKINSSVQISAIPSNSDSPAVAILYTTCNDFSEPSAESCVRQNYPYYTVYLLDDSSDVEYQKRVDDFAKKYPGKVEVVRRKNRRAFKAGNLNNALIHSIKKEPYFAIADADEILPVDFLSKLVPEMENDPKCGFVQANHRCNPGDRSKLAQALGVGIDIHWKWYQPLRNEYGFVMFLGHGALLRRSCWEEVGGFPEIVSEDLGFAIRIREKGYRGKFVEDVICYEDFPETIRAFRIRHMKWTRGTCEFLFRESARLLKSKKITWTEKFDILFPTLNLPLTLFYFLFMVNANLLIPLLFGKSQPLTLAFADKEFVMPFFSLDPAFSIIFSADFFIITMLTFFAPILCFVLELLPQPLKLFRFLSHSTAVYAALSPLSAVGVLSYLITGKATFLVTGDVNQSSNLLYSSATRREKSKIKLYFSEIIGKSHPDNLGVQFFEILVGLFFAVACLFLIQISFFGLCFAFVLFPIMHHISWENPIIQKFVYLPFSIILLGVMVGAMSIFGLQPVFFGYGFHF